MSSVTKVERESQPGGALYYNCEDEGISLGVLYFVLDDILDILDGVRDIAEEIVYEDANLQRQTETKLALAILGLKHACKVCGEISPFTDKDKRDIRVERHTDAPLTIYFREDNE